MVVASLQQFKTNEEIRVLAEVEAVSVLMRKKVWYGYGHVCKRDEKEGIGEVGNLSVEGERNRERPKHRRIDTIPLDLKGRKLKFREQK